MGNATGLSTCIFPWQTGLRNSLCIFMDNGITKDPYLLIVNNIKKHLYQFMSNKMTKGPHPRQRSSIATAISNGNLDKISPCMGSVNRNHHHDLQIAVAVAVDQNFLIFGGRSLKSRLRLLWCMGRSDQILSVVPLKTMLYSPGHQSRGLTLLRTAIQLRKIEQIGRCVCG